LRGGKEEKRGKQEAAKHIQPSKAGVASTRKQVYILLDTITVIHD
jgi:hypothetical protein